MRLIDRNIEWPVTISDTTDPGWGESFESLRDLASYVEFWARHSLSGPEETLHIKDAKGRNLLGLIDKVHVYVLVIEHNTKQTISDWLPPAP